MKKILLLIGILLTVISLSACDKSNEGSFASDRSEQPGNPGDDNDSDNEPTAPTPGGNGRYLVLFASRSGNTERMAAEICRQLDCDILEVEPEVAYDDDYNAMLDRAQAELAAIRQGNFPGIKTSVESFDDYEMIFVGYPIWYGSMATPMQAFLHGHAEKFAGKPVAFCVRGTLALSRCGIYRNTSSYTKHAGTDGNPHNLLAGTTECKQ